MAHGRLYAIGAQPFKARLENMSLSSLRDVLERRRRPTQFDERHTTGGDHNEASVDLGGWNWRVARCWDRLGPFSVSFIGKSTAGATLQTKTITIYVSK